MDIHSQMLQFFDSFDREFEIKFNQKFARENTNDRGEVLSPDVTQMLKYDLVTYFCFLRQYFQTERIEPKPIIHA